MSILIRAVGDLCLRLGALSCYEAEYEDYMLRCLPISQQGGGKSDGKGDEHAGAQTQLGSMTQALDAALQPGQIAGDECMVVLLNSPQIFRAGSVVGEHSYVACALFAKPQASAYRRAIGREICKGS